MELGGLIVLLVMLGWLAIYWRFALRLGPLLVLAFYLADANRGAVLFRQSIAVIVGVAFILGAGIGAFQKLRHHHLGLAYLWLYVAFGIVLVFCLATLNRPIVLATPEPRTVEVAVYVTATRRPTATLVRRITATPVPATPESPQSERLLAFAAHVELGTFEWIYVQAAPSVNADEVGRIYDEDEVFYAIGRTAATDWIFIERNGGMRGWMAVEFIRSNEHLTRLPIYP